MDWSNPNERVSTHFTVKEVLWLPSWNVLHTPSEQEKTDILKHVANMEKVREFLGASIKVHCWIRPVLNNPDSEYDGKDYNEFVKGAKKSSHKLGLATDFDVNGMDCDVVRTKLEPKLEEFGIRMEKMPGSSWVHIDSAEVINTRYFNP